MNLSYISSPIKILRYFSASNSRPQVLGVLKGRLNIKNVGAPDTNRLYRALHILEAQPDLSGNYTCSVSSLQSEDIRTKSMLVFGKCKVSLWILMSVYEDSMVHYRLHLHSIGWLGLKQKLEPPILSTQALAFSVEWHNLWKSFHFMSVS